MKERKPSRLDTYSHIDPLKQNPGRPDLIAPAWSPDAAMADPLVDPLFTLGGAALEERGRLKSSAYADRHRRGGVWGCAVWELKS